MSKNKIQVFSSGGGFYHAMTKYKGSYLVVTNTELNLLVWYEDSEFNEYIDGTTNNELSSEYLEIYNELVRDLKAHFPNIPYHNIEL